MFAIARNIGNDEVRKLLIIVANNIKHKNAATFVPWSIQICMLRWPNNTLIEVLVVTGYRMLVFTFFLTFAFPEKRRERRRNDGQLKSRKSNFIEIDPDYFLEFAPLFYKHMWGLYFLRLRHNYIYEIEFYEAYKSQSQRLECNTDC